MSFPKLSATLPHPRDPGTCQACGATSGHLIRWRECDDDDRPTSTVLITCPACDEAHVTPAERLYVPLVLHEYHPGLLPLCGGCPHRRGIDCELARSQGGPGIRIGPKPTRMHVLRHPKRLSGWMVLWKPATRCSGLIVPAEPVASLRR